MAGRNRFLAYRRGNRGSSGQRQLRCESSRFARRRRSHGDDDDEEARPQTVDPLKNWFRFPVNLLDGGGSRGEYSTMLKGRERDGGTRWDPTARDFWHTFHPWYFALTFDYSVWKAPKYRGVLDVIYWLSLFGCSNKGGRFSCMHMGFDYSFESFYRYYFINSDVFGESEKKIIKILW